MLEKTSSSIATYEPQIRKLEQLFLKTSYFLKSHFQPHFRLKPQQLEPLSKSGVANKKIGNQVCEIQIGYSSLQFAWTTKLDLVLGLLLHAVSNLKKNYYGGILFNLMMEQNIKYFFIFSTKRNLIAKDYERSEVPTCASKVFG